MRRDELEHLLRAASAISERRDVLVLGSQAILGTFDEDALPEAATMSMEADLAFLDDDDLEVADRVDGLIGEDSHFHRTHGIYGQGVSVTVAVLPDGWFGRLVVVEGSNTQPGRGLCLEPHDLVIAKLIAYREKDLEFASALISAHLVDVATLGQRLAATSAAAPIQRERVRVWLERHAG